MNAKQFEKLLEELNACKNAREWAEGKTLAQAWETCARADWMCWISVKMAGEKGWPNKSLVRLALCDCAETALLIYEKYYPKDDRPRNAIETARKYVEGKATDKELAAASVAAENAARAADWAAARDAARAVAWVVAWAADRAADWAADWAADSIATWAAAENAASVAVRDAASVAAENAASVAVRDAALKTMAELVRKRIGKFGALEEN